MPHWYSNQLGGWVDESYRCVRPKPINKSFVWQHGGSKRSRWGRIADIATGRGPDVYVAFNANRIPGAADGPSQRFWTGHLNLEENPYVREYDQNSHCGDWCLAGYRNPAKQYDFRSRRYRHMRPGMWSSANYLQNETTPVLWEDWATGIKWVRYPEATRGTLNRGYYSA